MLTDEGLREIRDKVAEAAITTGYDSLGWPQTYAEDVPRLLDEIDRLRKYEEAWHRDEAWRQEVAAGVVAREPHGLRPGSDPHRLMAS